jgi:hypothetical protein
MKLAATSLSSLLLPSVIAGTYLLTTTNCKVDGFTMVSPSSSSLSPSTATQLQMGLFDFFSDDARKAREEKKRKLVEEQERLQKAIMERRRNPELMEKYEEQVSIRRELKMKGDFDSASKIDQYEVADDMTLLDGRKPSP